MKNKKNIFIIIFTLIITSVVLFIIFLKLFYSITLDENSLRNDVITLFKSKLNRAVKFEAVQISLAGNIVVKRFDLSVSSDFNDNLSFISSPEIIIDLDFIELIMGEKKVKGIIIKEAEMNILKRYGKNYSDVLQQFVDLTYRINKFAQAQDKSFNITFEDCRLLYREILKDSELTINFYEIDFALSILSKNIIYNMSTFVSPAKSKAHRKGYISSKGEFTLSKITNFKHTIKIDNLDLSYLNQFLFRNTSTNIALTGGIFTECILAGNNNDYSFTGSIETNNLNLYTYSPEQHSLISNENVNILTDLQINVDSGAFNIREFKIHDDFFTIAGSAEYIKNKAQHSIKAQLKSNEINLTELSNYISPFRNIYYNGTLSFFLDFDYNILENITNASQFNLMLSGFNVNDISKDKKETLIEGLKANLKLSNNIIDTSIEGKSGYSDMRFTSNTIIESWYPLKSKSEVAIYSKNTEANLIYSITSRIFNSFIEDAYEDSKKGYEELFFLQKPIGKLVTNNDITFDFNSDRLLVNNPEEENSKLGFKNLSLGLSLTKGILTLRDFHLWGYNANFNLDVQGYFYRDYPHITCTGSVKNFDLASFCQDAAINNKLTGTLNGNFEYELNIYRIAHLLQNSRSSLDISIDDGKISESYILDKLNIFFNKNNYPTRNLLEDSFSAINIATRQYGENVYIRSFGYSGEQLTFNLTGKYTYIDGLDLSGACRVDVVKKRDETEYIKKQYVPLTLTGPLSEPCLDVKNKKDSSKTCFN